MKDYLAKENEMALNMEFEKYEWKGIELVKITKKNVAIAESIFRNDSSYFKATNKDAKPKGKYGGSSAYWINELKKCNSGGEEYEKIIKEIVYALDRENSTHLNSDGVGRDEIPENIYTDYKNPTKLKNALKRDNYEVYGCIARKTEKGRSNRSFASKFCHYLSYYLFKKEEDRDRYPIYDSVTKKALSYYLKEKSVFNNYNLDCYKQYKEAIDEIIRGKNISRNGLDHLLWLYYKGRI